MADQIIVAMRGGCGIDLVMRKDEVSENIYTTEACANPALIVGSSPITVRKLCADCPEKEKRMKTPTPTQPAPAPAPAAEPTPSETQEAQPAAAPAAEAPLPPPPQTAAPALPAPSAPDPAPQQHAAPTPGPVPTQEGLEQVSVVATVTPEIAEAMRNGKLGGVSMGGETAAALPMDVPPPGTPVVASPAHPADSGLVQGTVAGLPAPNGTVPVSWPGGETTMEKPEHIQVDAAENLQPLPPAVPAPMPTQVPAPMPTQVQPQQHLADLTTTQQLAMGTPQNVAPPAAVPVTAPAAVPSPSLPVLPPTAVQHAPMSVIKDPSTGAEIATCNCGTQHLAVERCPTEMAEALAQQGIVPTENAQLPQAVPEDWTQPRPEVQQLAQQAVQQQQAALPTNVPPPQIAGMQVQDISMVPQPPTQPIPGTSFIPGRPVTQIIPAGQPPQLPPAAPPQPAPQPAVIQHPAGPMAATPVVQPQGASSGSFLPGMNLSGLDDQSVVDVDAVLKTVAGLEGGPSTGGISWSTIKNFKLCRRRAFYATVLGLQKTGRSYALDLGSLVHACFELHYRTGGMRTFEPCDAIHNAGGVDLAADARRYVYAAIQKWGEEEALTWDVRSVELQATWFQDPVKILGKKVMIPWTCRHDLCVALRQPGGACHPPGQPVPHGVHITDHKTAHALSYDLTKGYGMDGQFKLNALIYRKAEAEQYGPLAGVIVSIIAKHKKMTPDSLFRVYTTADEASVMEFFEQELRQDGIDYYTLLADDATRNDPRSWPKNHASCVGRYGCCPFFDICDTPPGGEEAIIAANFRVDPDWQKNVKDFATPPMERKREAARATKTPEELADEQSKRDAKKEKRALVKSKVIAAFMASVAQYEKFRSSAYLREDVDKKTVKAELQEALSSAWEVGTNFKLTLDMLTAVEPASITITAKGMSWNAEGIRSSFTWSSIANEFVKDWWNLEKNPPQVTSEDEAADLQAATQAPQPAPQPPQE